MPAWRRIDRHENRKRRNAKRLVALYCALSSGLVGFLSTLWIHSMRYKDGHVEFHVNALYEGVLEAAAFLLLFVLGTFAWAQSMLDWREAETAVRDEP